MIEKHLQLLGRKVRDAVTNAEGIVESISFDLYGCVQAVVRVPIDPSKPGEIPEGRWFDVKRLTVLSPDPVMRLPDFAQPEIGAADKPLPRR